MFVDRCVFRWFVYLSVFLLFASVVLSIGFVDGSVVLWFVYLSGYAWFAHVMVFLGFSW